MTEIKRLSDADIEGLKTCQPCEDCPLDDKKNDIDRACWIYLDKSRIIKCKEIKNAAIRIEMEARERDKMEEKNQLPTESELRAELENLCNVVNKIGGLSAEINDCKAGNLQIKISANRDMDYVYSKWKQFRPDIVPPEKNTVVFVHYENTYRDGFFNFPVVSLGEITQNGSLKFQFVPCDCRYARYWYDPQTGNHSAGWDMAWLEGVI